MKRNDDFETRREHLKDLTDAELETFRARLPKI